MFAVPESIQIAGGIFQTGQRLQILGRDRRPRGLLGVPVVAQPMDENRAQPTAEGAVLLIVFKSRNLPDHGDEHFLHEVVGVRAFHAGLSQPTRQERRVQIDETLPGVLVRLKAKARATDCAGVSVMERTRPTRGDGDPPRAFPALTDLPYSRVASTYPIAVAATRPPYLAEFGCPRTPEGEDSRPRAGGPTRLDAPCKLFRLQECLILSYNNGETPPPHPVLTARPRMFP